MTRLFPHFVAFIAAFLLTTVDEDTVRKELGTVNWQRDFKAAKEASVESKKPLMVFFQEVPG